MPKKSTEKLDKPKKRKKRDYIVRIHVGNIHSAAIIRVLATSRKDAVELVKGAIEITGETINESSLERTNMDEEIVTTEEVVKAPVEETEVPAESAE